ncbi:WD40 repeat-like protein [Backusella circina FSU 941]|nr:WD40 repeat-like protein [Backusella circina FSU 941]
MDRLPQFFFAQKRQRISPSSNGNNDKNDKSDLNKIPPPLKRSHSVMSHLDKANELWLKQPVVLHSRADKIAKNVSLDRGLLQVNDMASAQVRLGKQETAVSDNDGHLQTHKELIAEACGYSSSKRILGYKVRAPEKTKEDTNTNLPDYKLNTTTALNHKRRILTSAEKVLDAPNMADDYYLNLLDWSKENIVAVGLGKSIYLWSADDGSVQSLNYKSDDDVTSIAWSSDSCYLSVGTGNGETQVWDVESNSRLRTMKGQNCRIGVLAWDKHIVTSGAQDGSIFLHDVRVANHKVSELNGHTADVCGLKWRWDGSLLASGGNDSVVNIWDPRIPSAPKYKRKAHTGAVKALAWCPWNHNLLATGGGRDDQNIYFWNTATGSRVNTIATGSQVTSLHWSKHYKEIASTHGYPHNQLSVWAYPSLSKVIDIPAHDQRILHSTLSPDGQVLATAAADENLKFWKIFEHHGRDPLHSTGTTNTSKAKGQLKRCTSIR